MANTNGRITLTRGLRAPCVSIAEASQVIPSQAMADLLAKMATLDQREWPAGNGPRLVWPIGFSATDARKWLYQVKPGTSFRVTSTPPNRRNLSYAIAERIEQPEWISYFHCRKSNRRRLFRVCARTPAHEQALCTALSVPAPVRTAR